MDAPNGKLKTSLHGARSWLTLVSLLGRHRALGTLPGKPFAPAVPVVPAVPTGVRSFLSDVEWFDHGAIQCYDIGGQQRKQTQNEKPL